MPTFLLAQFVGNMPTFSHAASRLDALMGDAMDRERALENLHDEAMREANFANRLMATAQAKIDRNVRRHACLQRLWDGVQDMPEQLVQMALRDTEELHPLIDAGQIGDAVIRLHNREAHLAKLLANTEAPRDSETYQTAMAHFAELGSNSALAVREAIDLYHRAGTELKAA